MTRRFSLSFLVLLALFATACSSSAQIATDSVAQPDSAGGVTSAADVSADSSEVLSLVEEQPEELTADESVDIVLDEDVPTEDEPVEEPPIKEPVVITPRCTAPEDEDRFIDVPVNDPDSALKLRSHPGSHNVVVTAVGRTYGVTTTGRCAPIAKTDWWEVSTTDGTQTGWVSSIFLSLEPELTPGVGAPVEDATSVGLSAPTLDELALAVAAANGFEEPSIARIAEPVTVEGSEGESEVSYRLSRSADGSTNGFVITITFTVDRTVETAETEETDEIVTYTASGVTLAPSCTRGVNLEGVCI